MQPIVKGKSNVALPKLWTSIARALETAIASNETSSPEITEDFNTVKLPPISISSYLERLYKYFRCSDSCIVLAYIYVERLKEKCSEVVLHRQNIYRCA